MIQFERLQNCFFFFCFFRTQRCFRSGLFLRYDVWKIGSFLWIQLFDGESYEISEFKSLEKVLPEQWGHNSLNNSNIQPIISKDVTIQSKKFLICLTIMRIDVHFCFFFGCLLQLFRENYQPSFLNLKNKQIVVSSLLGCQQVLLWENHQICNLLLGMVVVGNSCSTFLEFSAFEHQRF